MTTAGMCIIACAIIVGQVEDNRHIAWQKNKLQMDLEFLQQQAERNDEFVERLSHDANLVERLAQRQMNLVRSGQAVLELKNEKLGNGSPSTLVNVPPPPAVQPYEPGGGFLPALFGSARRRLWATALGAGLVAVSMVTGASSKRRANGSA